MDTVSVIIPNWNRSALLAKAITSVLNQTVQPLEILVCDDGSTDDSEAVVASFGNPIVKWLPGAPSGRPAVPRNRELRASQGEWLAFLDNDDEWLPTKLERQFEAVRKQSCLAACTNGIIVRQDGSVIGPMGGVFGGTVTFEKLVQGNLIICSSVLIHRSLLDLVGGFSENMALRVTDDYAMWLRVASRTVFAHVEEPMLRYLDHTGNIGKTTSATSWALRKYVLEDALNWSRLAAVPKSVKRAFQAELLEARVREALLPLEPVARRILGK